MELRTFMAVFVVVFAVNTGRSLQQRCVQSLDIILVVDGSNSVGPSNFEMLKTTLSSLIDSLAVNDSEVNVGVVLFSRDVFAEVELTGNKQAILSGIQMLDYPDEQTRTDLGIDAAIEMFRRGGRGGSVPRLMMLITDGAATERDSAIASAKRAKDMGIVIYALGVTKLIDEAELREIASRDDQVFFSANFSSLGNQLENATYRACVNFECDDAMIDIVFVMDSSSNIGDSNFMALKNFIKDFLLFADVDSGQIRVGLLTFSDNANAQFYLNANGRNKIRLVSAIDDVQYTPGGTNIPAALEALRTTMFTAANGDRPDIPNVVIFLSANSAGVDMARVIAEAEATRAQGIQIYAVGIGATDTTLVDNIASKPLTDNRFTTMGYNLTDVTQEVYQKFNKFCETPPPVPACFFGTTDIWLVVDVSTQAEVQARESTMGDFGKLQNGLLKMIEVIQDPSVANPGVRLGLITYSDNAEVTTNLTDMNSVNMTALAVSRIPGTVAQGGSNLLSALQRITRPPVMSDYKSYVAIIAPEASYMGNMANLEAELTRLKGLGYTIAVFASRENAMTSLNVMELQSSASGSNFFYNFQGYQELEAATKNFTRDRLCDDGKDGEGLCANSGHRDGGIGVVPHPMDCDKYIQCYYNPKDMLDLGVVRHCPMGLHYNAKNKTCSKPCEADCPHDHCMEDCEPYKMHGACGAYWECEDGTSKPKCCQQNFAFIPGVGCQLDFTCKDYCGPEKWCGMCQKKPNWDEPSGYDVMMMGGHMWMPRPCFYEDFDVVDCDCTAPRDHACPADRSYDFSDSKTMMDIHSGMKEGIRVSDVINGSMGIMLGDKSAVHVKVNPMNSKSEPFTVMLKYREMKTFSPYGETLLSSGLTCGNGNSLLVSANDQFIFAEIRGMEGRTSTVKVPTHGLNKDEFKSLVLAYDSGMLALSISDSKTQYIAQSDAPAGICFSCGLDLGAGLNKLSFDGEVQKIAVYSCAWPILY